jgi:hypothetical protein
MRYACSSQCAALPLAAAGILQCTCHRHCNCYGDKTVQPAAARGAAVASQRCCCDGQTGTGCTSACCFCYAVCWHHRLWESASKTAHSLPARLAVEHCVHEARGLDVLPSTVHKFRSNGDEQTASLLEDVIYAVSCATRAGSPGGQLLPCHHQHIQGSCKQRQ